MLKVTKTKDWKLYWRRSPLPDGAEALWLVTLNNEVRARLMEGRRCGVCLTTCYLHAHLLHLVLSD